MIETVDILGVRIANTNLDKACRRIKEWIDSGEKTYVCVAPVSTVMDCQRDPEYRAIVNSAGMTTPDGMPLVWLGRRRGCADIDRTYGPDLVPRMCGFGREYGIRHFFYGGTPEVLSRLTSRLQIECPDMVIAGTYSPPLRKIGEEEPREVIDQINETRPDILWIGLGSPKQDVWMARHREKLDVPVMVGVGAAFDFLAGAKPQAPRWMQRSGLEWAFRLGCEPRRLWKRYLIGNTQFLYFLIRDRLGSGRAE